MTINSNKAVAAWSAPTASWQLAGDLLSKELYNIIRSILNSHEFPTQWQFLQTVWINKPGKSPSEIQNRRPIN